MRMLGQAGRTTHPVLWHSQTSGAVLQSWAILPAQGPPFLSALSVPSAQAEVHCLKMSFLPKGANEEPVQGAQPEHVEHNSQQMQEFGGLSRQPRVLKGGRNSYSVRTRLRNASKMKLTNTSGSSYCSMCVIPIELLIYEWKQAQSW